MKIFIFNGVEYDHLPDPLDTGEFMISPMDEAKFVALGGEIRDDGKLSDFQICCARFRAIVFDIADFIHDPTFRGGLNEIHKLDASPYAKADPTTANTLYNRWTSADLACLYEGSKIGLGQPAWFKKCWKEYDEAQAKLSELKEPNPYDDGSFMTTLNPYED